MGSSHWGKENFTWIWQGSKSCNKTVTSLTGQGQRIPGKLTRRGHWKLLNTELQFISVVQSRPALCNPMNRSTPGLPVHHQLLEFTQTHAHWVSDVIQPSHPLLSPSPSLNLSQHRGLCKWVSSSHQVAKVLEFQLQHQSFQWIFRTDFLR